MKPAERAEMQLHGSTEANLTAAIRSANRLRGRAIYRDTVAFWPISCCTHATSCRAATPRIPIY